MEQVRGADAFVLGSLLFNNYVSYFPAQIKYALLHNYLKTYYEGPGIRLFPLFIKYALKIKFHVFQGNISSCKVEIFSKFSLWNTA